MSAALSSRFAKTSHLSLVHRVAKANGQDITLDLCLSTGSIILNYAAPFLVKRIIEALGDPTPERLSEGYVLATLAFSASLLKSQFDLNKLWRGRRGCIRTNTEISAAIFSKVLVAKDASGVAEGKGASGTGKIVSSMLILRLVYCHLTSSILSPASTHVERLVQHRAHDPGSVHDVRVSSVDAFELLALH